MTSNEGIPIVIDHGSGYCRAGYASEIDPALNFPNLMARYRGKSGAQVVQIGNDIQFAEPTKLSLRSAFEVNIPTSFDVVENVFDHVFTKLECNDSSIRQPILLTEPVCMPNYCRGMMSELLFECYGVPSVSYGVDALFSYMYNSSLSPSPDSHKDGIVVSMSQNVTHILPIYDSRLMPSLIKRISVGFGTQVQLLTRLLQQKYPLLPKDMTAVQIEKYFMDHCYYPIDYLDELRSIDSLDTFAKYDVTIPLAYNNTEAEKKTEEELERASNMRKQQAKRMQEMLAKKREATLVRYEDELGRLESLKSLKTAKPKEFEKKLEQFEFDSEGALDKAITNLRSKIVTMRNKILGIEEEEPQGSGSPAPPPEFPLVDIPDEELTEEQKREKRKQRLIKAGYVAREKARIAREEERARLAEEARLEEERRLANPEAWITEQYEIRQNLIQKIQDRERKKKELLNRRSGASQNRMKSITSLAGTEPSTGASLRQSKRRRKQDDDDDGDNFGERDEDWHIYREISKEEDDEEDESLEQLKAVENNLRKYDPTFIKKEREEESKSVLRRLRDGLPDPETLEWGDIHSAIHLNVERVRSTECLYQPSILGVDQTGLAITLSNLIESLTPTQQSRLAQRVFVTGGGTLIKGFNERLTYELRKILPFRSQFNVVRAKDPLLDAWRGARLFANSEQFSAASLYRKDYEEKGHDYLIEHNYSNVFYRLSAEQLATGNQ